MTLSGERVKEWILKDWNDIVRDWNDMGKKDETRISNALNFYYGMIFAASNFNEKLTYDTALATWWGKFLMDIREYL